MGSVHDGDGGHVDLAGYLNPGTLRRYPVGDVSSRHTVTPTGSCARPVYLAARLGGYVHDISFLTASLPDVGTGASVRSVDVEQLERLLHARLDALGPAPRAELLHVLMLPDLDRAERIGDFWANPKTRTFGELLIDCEEDRTLRAVLVGKQ